MADAELRALRAAEARLGIQVSIVGPAGGVAAAAKRIANLDGEIASLSASQTKLAKELETLDGKIPPLEQSVKTETTQSTGLKSEAEDLAKQTTALASLGKADTCRADHLRQIREDRTLPATVMPPAKRLADEVALVRAICPGLPPSAATGIPSKPACDADVRKQLAAIETSGSVPVDPVRPAFRAFEVWQSAAAADCRALHDRLSARLERIQKGGAPETPGELSADATLLGVLDMPLPDAPATPTQVGLVKFKVSYDENERALQQRRESHRTRALANADRLANANAALEKANAAWSSAVCELYGKKRAVQVHKEKHKDPGKVPCAVVVGVWDRILTKELDRRQAGEDHAHMSRADAIQKQPAVCDARHCKCVEVKRRCRKGTCVIGAGEK